eukprot:CAMPEP_0181316008 /NCGR_PEP_ID=MMETSP1101-20121128/15669_1 /TAXON_ID=46948 /ORGANISM="Rhodomonas abbreviata, Strain Caron Lab Isolate" /LENGTH=405 /DNA_ID=CAMNT_0023423233 /DNA_START=23 /DNA_END=1240 /DNA_ORIENTATION=+
MPIWPTKIFALGTHAGLLAVGVLIGMLVAPQLQDTTHIRQLAVREHALGCPKCNACPSITTPECPACPSTQQAQPANHELPKSPECFCPGCPAQKPCPENPPPQAEQAITSGCPECPPQKSCPENPPPQLAQPSALEGVVAVQASAPAESADIGKSNVKHYDAEYFKWQAALNDFGGVFKGDMFNFWARQFSSVMKISSMLEFGSSGGYIINAVNAERKVGVEINDVARNHHKSKFPSVESYQYVSEVPGKIDFIFSSSVIEHVNCPLTEIEKLRNIVSDNGVFILHVRNDGLNSGESSWPGTAKTIENNHIYTWNAALLGNMMKGAGWEVCAVTSEFSAWHGGPNYKQNYLKDKKAYCKTALTTGQKNKVQAVYGMAVPTGPGAKERCKQLKPLFAKQANCGWA